MPVISINPSDFGPTASREIFDLSGASRDLTETLAGGVTSQETEWIQLNMATKHILRGDIGGGWFIKAPIEAEVLETEDDTVLISDNEFGFYGEGEDFEKAKTDYLTALKTHYKIYKGHLDNNEDPDTLRQFRYMQIFINAPDYL